MQRIEVVVGGQYGSEAKGHVTAQLVKQALRENDAQVINVRVAGPNAGHTVYDAEGNKFAFRQVPVGAVLGDEVFAYIAPGSEVDWPVLLAEVEAVRKAGHEATIAMSREVTIIDSGHKTQEAELVGKIGSTGKGIGAARAARLLRTADRLADRPELLAQALAHGIELIEPKELYSAPWSGHLFNQHIIIEGTQGFGLGLHAGHYPQVTSSDCTALDFLAMAQVSPWRASVAGFAVWVVVRPHPIRVAGNSGPLKGETTWEALGLAPEYTTVTQKVRRVGEWDGELVARAVEANGGAPHVRVALSMADQVLPVLTGFDGSQAWIEQQNDRDGDVDGSISESLDELHGWLASIMDEVNAPVGMVTTSPSTAFFVHLGFSEVSE